MYEDAYLALKSAHFDVFDIYVETSQVRSVEGKNRRIENIKVGYDSGVGIRGVRGLSVLFSATTDKSEENVLKLSKFIADTANPLPGVHILSNPQEVCKIEGYGGYPEDLNFVGEIFGIINDVAYRRGEVKQVSLSFSDQAKEIVIINEEGSIVKEKRLYTTLYIEMTARRGDVVQTWRQPFSAIGGSEFLMAIDFGAVAEEMVEKLVQLLWAPPLKAETMCVILSSRAGGTMIHEAVGHGLEADLVYESMSIYQGRKGEKVASELISVIDDATLPYMRGSYYYDDEGVKSGRTVLIENGVLKGYLFDKMYGNLAGEPSTGNGRRESFRHPPMVRMSNTFIDKGEYDPEEIVGSVERGLLVEKMGGGQVNPITGDFVFEVMEGYLIKNGKRRHMVRGASLMGNGPEVLKTIEMVGNDMGTEVGTCGKSGQGIPVTDGEPTIKIPRLLVGGSRL